MRWITAWLEMLTEPDDGRGGKIRSSTARKERKCTPHGAPIPSLASTLYLRRFILGWKVRGDARRFPAVTVKDADDVVVLGTATSTEMLAVVEEIMTKLNLPSNDHKTRC